VFDLLLRLFSEPQLVARKPAELSDWFRRVCASRFISEIVRKLTAKGKKKLKRQREGNVALTLSSLECEHSAIAASEYIAQLLHALANKKDARNFVR
jgi:hypothetical protein